MYNIRQTVPNINYSISEWELSKIIVTSVFQQSKIISFSYFIDVVNQFRCNFMIVDMFNYLKNLYLAQKPAKWWKRKRYHGMCVRDELLWWVGLRCEGRERGRHKKHARRAASGICSLCQAHLLGVLRARIPHAGMAIYTKTYIPLQY